MDKNTIDNARRTVLVGSTIATAPADKLHRTAGVLTTRDNVEICYKDWGPRNGQPVVLSHGWPLPDTHREQFNADFLAFAQA